jgi:hypothetical protein
MISLFTGAVFLCCVAGAPFENYSTELVLSAAIPAESDQGKPGPIRDSRAPRPSTNIPVTGGTPEPGMLLLLTGGGLAYVGLRNRQRRRKDLVESDQNV